MPIRDILVSTVIFGSLPFCFLGPWIGVLVWSWIGYMNPHRLTWGFAHDMPFAQMVAIATISGLILTKEKYPLPSMREVYLLALFSLMMFVSTLFAYYPADAWQQFDKVWKILLMSAITIILFQDPKKVRALVWVIALSIGFYGLKGGIYVVRTGGAHNVQGPEGSFIGGNTEIGLALNMILPFLVFLRRETTNPWLRHLLSIMFGFTIVAIVGTYSRGAFLGLVVVLTLLFLKSRTKMLAIVLLAIAIPLAMSTLPEKWFGRMETIQTYEKDSSAMGRIQAWHVAYYLAKERPLSGFGFRPFTEEIFRRYGYGKAHDGHSIFFQVLAEHGFTGLILYTGLIASSFLTLRRLKRVSRSDPSLQWVYNYSQMLQASLAAYVVCGAFLSLSYFDLFYHLVAIVIILKKLVLVHEQERAKTHARALVQPALAPVTIR